MDLKVIESLNGGELVKTSKDLTVIEGIQNMVYLALFGGNVLASTTNKRLETEQDFSWWGNPVLHPNEPDLQFNSITERNLINIPLTSSGRSQIESGVKQDLAFMKSFARVAVVVSIVDHDKVLIGVKIQQPDNLDNQQFIYIWDATKKELSLPETKGGSVTVVTDEGIFDFTFDFSFE